MSGAAPARADELKARAEVDYRSGDYQQAGEQFREASAAYGESGDRLAAAEMANNACVAFLRADQPERALGVVQGTPELFLQADDLRRASQAYGNRANALEALGHLDEAEADYRLALNGFEQVHDRESIQSTRQALSALRLRQSRPLEALTEMRLGLEGKRDLPLRHRVIRWILRLPSRFLPL